ncbi:hypothetical protein VNO77_24848 [Canavalia gladiata]|uniref:Uncharacterized protein n=1 Tax=Canavalia gladiata TaxID=3824 RepID=A0AAN9QAC9_CANGL
MSGSYFAIGCKAAESCDVRALNLSLVIFFGFNLFGKFKDSASLFPVAMNTLVFSKITYVYFLPSPTCVTCLLCFFDIIQSSNSFTRDYLDHASSIMKRFRNVVNWLKAKPSKGDNLPTFTAAFADKKLLPLETNNRSDPVHLCNVCLISLIIPFVYVEVGKFSSVPFRVQASRQKDSPVAIFPYFSLMHLGFVFAFNERLLT